MIYDPYQEFPIEFEQLTVDIPVGVALAVPMVELAFECHAHPKWHKSAVGVLAMAYVNEFAAFIKIKGWVDEGATLDEAVERFANECPPSEDDDDD